MPQSSDWSSLFAARTAHGANSGLMEILRLANAAGIISFAGGFPDPATFPRQAIREGLAEIIEADDFSAFQYSPTPGCPDRGTSSPPVWIASRAPGRRLNSCL